MASFPPAVVAAAKEKAEELEEFQQPAGGALGKEEEPQAKRRLMDKHVSVLPDVQTNDDKTNGFSGPFVTSQRAALTFSTFGLA